MFDFLIITTRSPKKNVVEILPDFKVLNPSADLMIKGNDFHAVWVEEKGLWSKSEQDAIDIIDRELVKYYQEYIDTHDVEGKTVKIMYMSISSTGSIDRWHHYCRKQMSDSWLPLDETLIFSNTTPKKEYYASKKLPYPLEPGDVSAWDKLIGTLYFPEQRHKLEWSIGAIITGDSKFVQKFIVMHGAPGTGKGTFIKIVRKLFKGYYTTFKAKDLASSSNSFPLEPFKDNPLVAIDEDGNLSKIEDNTVLNSLVSHEPMPVNTKFKSVYTSKFNCFLFMGTNSPVKITDAKSGLLRRLIDVYPSGKKLSTSEYNKLLKQIDFELGAIAAHCRDVYLADPEFYDDYVPLTMMGASNDFYNFIVDSYHIFKKEDGTTLKAAWEMYKQYCEDARVPYGKSRMVFKEELKSYFWNFSERFVVEDGSRVSSYYSGFRTDKFETEETPKEKHSKTIDIPDWLTMTAMASLFDVAYSKCPAQYSSDKGTPNQAWDNVVTTLESIDSSRLHYVRVPENHIVIDFDLKNEKGEKDLALNLAAASYWPATYAELSKSGQGIHLHYIYSGDVSRLSRVYSDGIEVKVFTGKSSLRRKLTKCNDISIATISSNLPLKGDDKVVDFEGVKNEKALRTIIKRNLNKEYHSSTKCSIDFIASSLDDMYKSGAHYDVSDLKNAVIAFAAQSTNQSDYCMKAVAKMKFKSEEPSAPSVDISDSTNVFYDVEVFPNLFLVNYKAAGLGKPVVRMINPKPSEIESLLRMNLIGFNCRRYDNHMLYARYIGYTNEQLYDLSQKIVGAKKGSKGVFFGEAYNISKTDIYDFASAGNKKSLKKLEIEMNVVSEAELAKRGFTEEEIAIIKAGRHHQELGLPWDQPVPEERWIEVAEYCDNDVIATEAAFTYLKADWTAREILADLAGLTVNDTTNTLTTRIIFGSNKKPQGEFCYRDMAKPVHFLPKDVEDFLKEACPVMMSERHGPYNSLLPYFDGYKYEAGKSTYMNEEVGEGGYVYAEPGIYTNVALLDIASMHPHSAIAECIFGPRFTKAFRDIVEGRVSIKHEAWEEVNHMLDGKLTPYIQKVIDGELTSKQLADALKTAINSVYGLTAASFENPFHDPRNIDNIVAKRGALFMVDLKHAVQAQGFTVAHIKTDSIKIPGATPEIIKFVMDFGQRYGYTFEHEATYERMCLVNDAVYIARYKDGKHAGEWTATGAQFAVPYVFKTLFSKEPIVFSDMCETKSVSSSLYLDMNEQSADEHDYRFVGKIGLFCPIKPGCGGGELMRQSTDKEGNIKYDSATGAKGYRWLEAETVEGSGRIDDIDRGYYRALVDGAVETISKYGDFEWFVSTDDHIDEPYFSPWESAEPPWNDETPFDVR